MSNSGTIEAQTVMKKKQAHIVWEEALLFLVKEKELPEGTLTLTLRNCDKFSRHSIIGEIKPNLASVGEQYGPIQSEKVKVLDKVFYQFTYSILLHVIFSCWDVECCMSVFLNF